LRFQRTLQLAEKYIATGRATQENIEKYCVFAEEQSAWAIYYSTVRVIAQRTVLKPSRLKPSINCVNTEPLKRDDYLNRQRCSPRNRWP
jgi:hypothetical protein